MAFPDRVVMAFVLVALAGTASAQPLTDEIFQDGFDTGPCTEEGPACEMERLRYLIRQRMAASVCVPQGTVGSSSYGLDYCYTNGCAGGTLGCTVSPQVETITFSNAGPGHVTVDVGFQSSALVPLDGDIGFSSYNCTMGLLGEQQGFSSLIDYELDAATGKYRIAGENRVSTAVDWTVDGCGVLLGVAGDLVGDILAVFSGTLALSTSLFGLEF